MRWSIGGAVRSLSTPCAERDRDVATGDFTQALERCGKYRRHHRRAATALLQRHVGVRTDDGEPPRRGAVERQQAALVPQQHEGLFGDLLRDGAVPFAAGVAPLPGLARRRLCVERARAFDQPQHASRRIVDDRLLDAPAARRLEQVRAEPAWRSRHLEIGAARSPLRRSSARRPSRTSARRRSPTRPSARRGPAARARS